MTIAPPSLPASPVSIEAVGDTLYIDIGEIQISVGAAGVLVTCPPHLLAEAAALVTTDELRALVATATTHRPSVA
jgi:hypothetical protein